MPYTATQFTLCGTPAGDLPGGLMDRATTEAAARRVASYCARFHQPEIAIQFEGVPCGSATSAWLRDAVETFRCLMPPECAVTFSMLCGDDPDQSSLDTCAELGIVITLRLNAPHRIPVLARSIGRHLASGRMLGSVECLVTPGEDGGQIYRRLRSLGIDMMDFVLPSEMTWNRWPAEFPTGTPFADYLIAVFDEWWSENHPTVRIAFFDRLLQLLLGSRVREDSLAADWLTTVVVHSDGRWGLANVFKVCGGRFQRLGVSVHTDPVERVFHDPVFQLVASAQETLPGACRECGLRSVCGGGDLPSRFSPSRAFDNASIFCADLTKIIHHVAETCAREVTSAC